MDRQIVALLGKKRAGKDTIAARLMTAHGYSRVAFADPLKRAALEANPLIDVGQSGTMRLADLVGAVGWERAKDDDEVRRFLQALGLGMRVLDPDIWVSMALRQADALPGPLVFTDVRFPNEAAALAQLGAVTVRVIRDGTGDDDHVSETALDDFATDITVYNVDTIKTLNEATDGIAKYMNALVSTLF